jgi:hypothetical protein
VWRDLSLNLWNYIAPSCYNHEVILRFAIRSRNTSFVVIWILWHAILVLLKCCAVSGRFGGGVPALGFYSYVKLSCYIYEAIPQSDFQSRLLHSDSLDPVLLHLCFTRDTICSTLINDTVVLRLVGSS